MLPFLRRYLYRLCIWLFLITIVAWVLSPWIGMGIVFRGTDTTGSGSVYSMAGSVRFLYTSSGTHEKSFSLPMEFWRNIQSEPWNGTLGGTPWRRIGFGYIRETAVEENYTQLGAPIHKVFVPHWAIFLPVGLVVAVPYLRRRPEPGEEPVADSSGTREC